MRDDVSQLVVDFPAGIRGPIARCGCLERYGSDMGTGWEARRIPSRAVRCSRAVHPRAKARRPPPCAGRPPAPRTRRRDRPRPRCAAAPTDASSRAPAPAARMPRPRHPAAAPCRARRRFARPARAPTSPPWRRARRRSTDSRPRIPPRATAGTPGCGPRSASRGCAACRACGSGSASPRSSRTPARAGCPRHRPRRRAAGRRGRRTAGPHGPRGRRAAPPRA